MIEWAICDTNKKKIREESNRPLLVMVPGLMGDSSWLYVTSMTVMAHELGYDVVFINFRGIGSPITIPKIYSPT